MASYFERIGPTLFRATSAVGGAWNTAEQHIAPALGLLVHVMEQDHSDRRTDALRVARVSFDILGTLPIDTVELSVKVVRPGRSIELVEAVLSHDQRPAVVARAWFMQTADTRAIAGTALPKMPPPAELAPWEVSEIWPGRFVTTTEGRRTQTEPGRAWSWIKPRIPLLAGEQVSPTARLLALVDIANGLTPRVSPESWAFPNLDLTAHLFREPTGEWIGFDTTVSFGDSGIGLTQSALHDERGPLGTVQQSLTLRPRQSLERV